MNQVPHRKGSPRAVMAAIAALAVIVAGLVAGCGSSSSDTTSDSTASKEAAANVPKEYDGPAADLPAGFPKPKSTGEDVTIGYLQIYGALPGLAAEQKGAEKVAEELGAKVIVKDAELNPQLQVTEFKQLLAQGVDGIIVYPVVPESLAQPLKAAEAAGIPVVTKAARPDVSKPLMPGIAADLEAPIDRQAFAMAQYAAETQPGAKFGIIGNAAPVAALEYLAERQRYWGEKFGLEFVGQVDAKQDTPSGYGPAVTELIASSPDIEEVWGYNEPLALTASRTLRASGKDEVKVLSAFGASESVLEAVGNGELAMVYAAPWGKGGEELMNGIYDAVTEQHLPLPETVSPLGETVTEENVDSVEPTA
ncbi:MAG: sugar ABC transporter substrate-binding protein [Solirubrobacterales bacterium]